MTGIPHPVDENHPVAIIVTKQNTLVTEDELVQYIEGKNKWQDHSSKKNSSY